MDEAQNTQQADPVQETLAVCSSSHGERRNNVSVDKDIFVSANITSIETISQRVRLQTSVWSVQVINQATISNFLLSSENLILYLLF